jgi:hypothetical protein
MKYISDIYTHKNPLNLINMKKITILSLFLIYIFSSEAQITITSADMPNAGDSIQLSVTNTIGTIDATLTGANYNWDYSTLTYTSQRVDKFDSPLSFPLVFAILFNPFNCSYGRENRAITAPTIPTVTITNAYDFLKESSSALKQVGGGLTVNGTPIPFNYTPNDYIYRFPLNFGNIDSSDYQYNLTIPTIGYYGETGHRVNVVDGWGTLLTPFNTFNTVRVKSVITSKDTLNYTSFGFGVNIPRPTRIEYKWLANGKQIPVLEIDENIVGGTPTITNVQYQDSVHSTVGINTHQNSVSEMDVFPNPSSNNFILKYNVASASHVKISINDFLGNTVATLTNENQVEGIYLKAINAKDNNLSEGVYFITVQSDNFKEVKKIIVQK